MSRRQLIVAWVIKYNPFKKTILSKLFFRLFFVIMFVAVLAFLDKHWSIGIFSLIAALIAFCISYCLVGGRTDPEIWKNKSLFDLLRHATLTGEAIMGFHSPRDQKEILVSLASIGIRVKSSENARKFIRDNLISNCQAFYVLRDYIIIQTIHNDKECFWDGYGNKSDVQFFHKAEIIFDLKPTAYYMFSKVLKDLE